MNIWRWFAKKRNITMSTKESEDLLSAFSTIGSYQVSLIDLHNGLSLLMEHMQAFLSERQEEEHHHRS